VTLAKLAEGELPAAVTEADRKKLVDQYLEVSRFRPERNLSRNSEHTYSLDFNRRLPLRLWRALAKLVLMDVVSQFKQMVLKFDPDDADDEDEKPSRADHSAEGEMPSMRVVQSGVPVPEGVVPPLTLQINSSLASESSPDKRNNVSMVSNSISTIHKSAFGMREYMFETNRIAPWNAKKFSF